MRVCLVTSELAPFCGWGVGSAAAAWTRALVASRHEVHLLTPEMPGLGRFGEEFPDATHHRLRVSPHTHYPTEESRHTLGVFECLRDLHAATPFDYIGFNDLFGDGFYATTQKRLAGELAGAVLGVHLHTPIFLLHRENEFEELDRRVAILTHLEQTAINAADLLVAPSRAMFQRLARTPEVRDAVSGTSPRGPRPAVIPHPLDGAASRERLAPPAGDGPREILYLGRIERLKGVEELVRAAAMVMEERSDFVVRLIGSDSDTGPMRSSLADQLQRLVPAAHRARFHWEGRQERSRVREALAQAWALCLPSRWDNFPCAGMEALAAGRPVITSDAGGLVELVEHDVSALVFPAGDAAALAACLRRVLGEPGLAARLGEAGAARVREVCDPARFAASLEREVRAARAAATSEVTVTTRGADVSVIVPCFNTGATLAATVASVRAQTQPPREIVIVDDGSTDAATIAAIDALAGPGCRVIRQANRGLAATRNTGVRATTTRLILPLDSDDRLAPTFIERCLRALASDTSLGAVSSAMSCFRSDPAHPVFEYLPLGVARDILPVGNVAIPSIAVIRREVFDAVRGYDESLPAYEDWDLWCRVIKAGFGLGVLSDRLIHSQVRADSLVRSVAPARQHALRAAILTRHIDLARDPRRPAQLLLSEAMLPVHEGWGPAGDHGERVPIVIRENLRYRLADKANDALKAVGVQRLIKRLIAGTNGEAGPR